MTNSGPSRLVCLSFSYVERPVRLYGGLVQFDDRILLRRSSLLSNLLTMSQQHEKWTVYLS